MQERKPYRLPTNVVPERYEIKLAPDLSAAKFTGEERIVVQVLEPVQQVVVNSAELPISSGFHQGAGR